MNNIPQVKAHANSQYNNPSLNGWNDDTAIMEEAFGRFFDFLDELKANGVPKESVLNAIERLKYFINIGVEPTVAEVLGIDNNYGLSGLFDNSFVKGAGDPLSTGTEMIGNITDMFNTGDVTGTLQQNAPPGSLVNVISSLLPEEILNNTFGSVFANGFDLSCWNASYSEQKAKAHIEVDMPFIITWSGIDKNPSTVNFDKFQLLSESYLLDAIHGQSSKYASCTRKGHALRQKAVEELRKNTYGSFQNNGFILSDNGRKTGNLAIPSGFPGYGVGIPWNRTGITYDSFIVKPPVPVQDLSNSYVDENDNIATTQTQQTQQAGFGIGSIILLVGAIAGTYFYTTQNKNKTGQKEVIPIT